ncbi:uncharacterized protein LOC130749880 isoform X2 [Actinidia eriantha]|uniref:uncharacterized protein LOC130749880 isoform X2 n=1 Tax=Actinidia eriantha TaxID=165200 RepID=UPI002586E44A|nr:uncharacterized protein LOC130749880 isoform X2 [Actinidia eriantha]
MPILFLLGDLVLLLSAMTFCFISNFGWLKNWGRKKDQSSERFSRPPNRHYACSLLGLTAAASISASASATAVSSSPCSSSTLITNSDSQRSREVSQFLLKVHYLGDDLCYFVAIAKCGVDYKQEYQIGCQLH